jgi:ATP-dependent DNA ligase
MHQATAAVMGEGTCSKRLDSPYRPGRSRRWLKIKHEVVETFDLAGWRPSTPSRPGGLIVAQHGEIIGVAALAISDEDRRGLVALIERHGRRHPTGSITIGEGVQATVHYTSRTPTHGHLREAFVVSVYPAGPLTALTPESSENKSHNWNRAPTTGVVSGARIRTGSPLLPSNRG